MTWTDFTQRLLPHLPKLTTAELGYNRLDHLSDKSTGPKPPTTDTKLSTVNFDGNSLSDWSDICLSFAEYPTCVVLASIAARPKLTGRGISPVRSVNHLVLSLNAIENIPPLAGSEEGLGIPASRGLTHVKSLTLSSNNLRSWADIDALADHCPLLETLSITGNPIVEGQSPRSYVLLADLPLTSRMIPQRSTVELSS